MQDVSTFLVGIFACLDALKLMTDGAKKFELSYNIFEKKLLHHQFVPHVTSIYDQ